MGGSRSLYKGPYVNESLIKKVKKAKDAGDRKVIKTWARDCTIIPDFVGLNLAVYNGQKFIPLHVTEDMIGHKLGEFSITRTYRGHGNDKKGRK